MTIATQTLKFGHVKVGDRVWLRRYGNERADLKEVTKVTPAQIVLAGRVGYRYRRSNGSAVGFAMYPSISAVATPDEVEAWEAAREAERREVEHRQQAEAEIEAKRGELNALLPGHAHVRQAEGGQWDVTVQWLSEDGVRKLAELLK